LGVSGGAPYALACVRSIPRERLLGTTIASGLYPTKFGTAGMKLQTRVLLWLAPWMTGATAFLFDSAMGMAARDEDPKVFEDLMSKEIDNGHAGDQLAMKDPCTRSTFVAMTRGSFHQGSEGASWEVRLNGSEWGFELAQLNAHENAAPIILWHGTEDVNCPANMARKANEMLHGSVLHMREGDGHLSYIFREADDILSELIGQEEREEYVRVGM